MVGGAKIFRAGKPPDEADGVVDQHGQVLRADPVGPAAIGESDERHGIGTVAASETEGGVDHEVSRAARG